MDSMGRAYQRPIAAADALAADAVDSHRFLDKRVLLTGDSFVLTPNGGLCLDYATRLVAKICRNVSVSLPGPASGRLSETRELTARVAMGTPIDVDDSVPDPTDFDAILSVSRRPFNHHRSTSINSNGWLCRIGSLEPTLDGPVDQYNPIGALTAASFGCSEVFKRLIALKPERGLPIQSLTFSAFTYSCGSVDPGPPIPRDIPLDVGLVGLGAIGNATATLLAGLPVSGRALAIDFDTFEDVNLSTCLSIGPADVGRPKAEFVQSLLSSRLEVVPLPETVQRASDRFNGSLRSPRVFLNGLDAIEPRHYVQGLWPDLVVDGAMGGSSLAQVSIHPWTADVACLKCVFREVPQEPAEIIQVRATGLRPERVTKADSPVTEQDVTDAPEERKRWLRDRLGRPVCSVIEEGVADELSQSRQRADFRPAVPFVATMSASMIVGELIRARLGVPSPLAPRYQLDLFQGPQRGQLIPQTRRVDCECSTRRANIERFRAARYPEPT
jgi:hypothetical protein